MILAPVATMLTAAAPVSGDLALVQQHLRSVDSMTANFSQADRSGRVVTGTLTLKKPGKIRFQYEKGVPILIVGDGKALIFVDYSVRQVQRWPIGNSPLGILLNPNRDIGGVARILPSVGPDIVSVEARDPRHPEYGRITLVFARDKSAPAGLMLQGWVSLDAQNNRTTVRLTNQAFNIAIADNAFRWNDPRGAALHK
jgi:outer membrane lipoprotein-sorting protein